MKFFEQTQVPPALESVTVLWNYLVTSVVDVTTGSDVVLALGSHDLRVADYAAKLAIANACPLILTGGRGKLTRHAFNLSEAEAFYRRAVAHGVPPAKMLVEDDSSNTMENAAMTRAKHGHLFSAGSTGLLVCAPYCMRRAVATFQKQWPELVWSASSHTRTRSEAQTALVQRSTLILRLADEVRKLQIYAQAGHSARVEIPPAVLGAAIAVRLCGQVSQHDGPPLQP